MGWVVVEGRDLEGVSLAMFMLLGVHLGVALGFEFSA